MNNALFVFVYSEVTQVDQPRHWMASTVFKYPDTINTTGPTALPARVIMGCLYVAIAMTSWLYLAQQAVARFMKGFGWLYLVIHSSRRICCFCEVICV